MADYLLIFRLNMEDTELNEENTKPFKNAHNKQANKWTNIEKTQQNNSPGRNKLRIDNFSLEI